MIGVGASMVLAGLVLSEHAIRHARHRWVGWVGFALTLTGCIVTAGES